MTFEEANSNLIKLGSRKFNRMDDFNKYFGAFGIKEPYNICDDCLNKSCCEVFRMYDEDIGEYVSSCKFYREK